MAEAEASVPKKLFKSMSLRFVLSQAEGYPVVIKQFLQNGHTLAGPIGYKQVRDGLQSGHGRGQPHAGHILDTLSATASRSHSNKSAYTSSVIAAEAWPSILCTTFGRARRDRQ